MSAPLCFNELSALPPAQTRTSGEARAVGLARLLAAVVARRPQFRTQESFWATELAPGYTLAEWARSASSERELRLIMLKIGTSAPLLRGAPAAQNLAGTIE